MQMLHKPSHFAYARARRGEHALSHTRARSSMPSTPSLKGRARAEQLGRPHVQRHQAGAVVLRGALTKTRRAGEPESWRARKGKLAKHLGSYDKTAEGKREVKPSREEKPRLAVPAGVARLAAKKVSAQARAAVFAKEAAAIASSADGRAGKSAMRVHVSGPAPVRTGKAAYQTATRPRLPDGGWALSGSALVGLLSLLLLGPSRALRWLSKRL